jgi:ABC-type molybdate transport system permease subunit
LVKEGKLGENFDYVNDCRDAMLASHLAITVAVFLFILPGPSSIYIYSLMDDSKGNAPAHPIQLFSLPLFICLGLLAVYSFGVHFFIAYLKTGTLNKPVFFSWSAVFIGGSLLYYGISTVRHVLLEHNHKRNFVKVQVAISLLTGM